MYSYNKLCIIMHPNVYYVENNLPVVLADHCIQLAEDTWHMTVQFLSRISQKIYTGTTLNLQMH